MVSAAAQSVTPMARNAVSVSKRVVWLCVLESLGLCVHGCENRVEGKRVDEQSIVLHNHHVLCCHPADVEYESEGS
jgi:hypothetical protein